MHQKFFNKNSCIKYAIMRKKIPIVNVEIKLRPRFLAKRKGTKNVRDKGTPTKILFANNIVLSKSLFSMQEKPIEIILTSGNAIRKPESIGFFIDSQLAKAIRMPENKTLAIKNSIDLIITSYPKKFFIFEIGLLKGS